MATGVHWLTGFGVAALLWYAASCWMWPFRRCRLCDGLGRHARKDRQVWRLCWWCKGSGRRLRYGRRAWEHWHRRAQQP